MKTLETSNPRNQRLYPRTCQNPSCPRPEKKFMGRQFSKGCSPGCRQSVYRATLRAAQAEAPPFQPTPELETQAQAAYGHWLNALRQRLSVEEPARVWTKALILQWAETSRLQWCKEWIEVERLKAIEPVVEAVPRSHWEGWRPSTTWNHAGGGSD